MRPAYLDMMRFVALALVFAACTDDVAVFTDRDTFGAGDSLAGEVDINEVDINDVDADTFEADTINLDLPLADLDTNIDAETDGAELDVGPDTAEGLLND